MLLPFQSIPPSRYANLSLYYVTLQTEEQLTDSSSKVEAIAKEIKKLTKADPTVKIVIFSQWTHVLNILEEALVQTNISFRSRLGKFYQTIKEFKVSFYHLESWNKDKKKIINCQFLVRLNCRILIWMSLACCFRWATVQKVWISLKRRTYFSLNQFWILAKKHKPLVVFIALAKPSTFQFHFQY